MTDEATATRDAREALGFFLTSQENYEFFNGQIAYQSI